MKSTEKRASGGRLFGTFFELGGATAAECLGLAGLDFFIIDTEHGIYNQESIAQVIRVAALRGAAPYVRIADASRPNVLRALDMGAKALIIPDIRTPEEVASLVEYGKYFPIGRRGYAPTRSSGFGFEGQAGGLEAYFEDRNRETLLLPQCETAECLAHIEEIAAIDGVDGIFLGPYDLSVALKKPGQLDTPEHRAATARILAACKGAGKLAFTYAGTMEAARQYCADGFDGIAYSMDAIEYTRSYQALMAQLRALG